jgi:hypothetical protein
MLLRESIHDARSRGARALVVAALAAVVLLPLLACGTAFAGAHFYDVSGTVPNNATWIVYADKQHRMVGDQGQVLFWVTDQAQGGLHLRIVRAENHNSWDPGHWFEPGPNQGYCLVAEPVGHDAWYHFKARQDTAGSNTSWAGSVYEQ